MSSPKQPPKPPSGKRLDDPYVYGDAIPTPDAHEKDTASAWALFNELTEKQEDRFVPTTPGSGPAPLRGAAPPTPAPGYEATAPASMQGSASAGREAPLGIDELMIEARRNNRVCPRLEDWQKLYALLPGKQEVDGRMQPPPPISPQAWRVTSAMVKRLCLRDHLEWAVAHKAVLPVLMFLRNLPEANWLHME